MLVAKVTAKKTSNQFHGIIKKLTDIADFTYGLEEQRSIVLFCALREKCPNTELLLVFTFPVFGLNTEIYEVNLRIQLEYRKKRTRKISVFGHFSRSGTYKFIFHPKLNGVSKIIESKGDISEYLNKQNKNPREIPNCKVESSKG